MEYYNTLREYTAHSIPGIRAGITELTLIPQSIITIGIIPSAIANMQITANCENPTMHPKPSNSWLSHIMTTIWKLSFHLWKTICSMNQAEKDQTLQNTLVRHINGMNIGHSINRRDEFLLSTQTQTCRQG